MLNYFKESHENYFIILYMVQIQLEGGKNYQSISHMYIHPLALCVATGKRMNFERKIE